MMLPAAGSGAAPLSKEEAAARLDALGPFEARPVVAVAVSGGADSLALTLFADAWARARGGRVVGLTVDHRLRPEAADEAARVARRLAALGIEHHTLVRDGPPPATGLQEAARRARYRLLEAWCRARGVLHLLLGHHAGDQAETLLMRLGRGSGADGLAAMPAVAERRHVRLLRPFLDVDPARLRAALEARGEDWVEDPTNRDTTFERVRLRQARPVLETAGLDGVTLAATARRLGAERAAAEAATARLLAATVGLHPLGFARVDGAALLRAGEDAAGRALARLLLAVGGRAYGPRRTALARLVAGLAEGGGSVSATLAGCRLLPWQGGLLVCREARNLPEPLTLAPGGSVLWDGRLRLVSTVSRPLRVVAGRGVAPGLPAPAGAALPVAAGESGIFAAAGFQYNWDHGSAPGPVLARVSWQPRNPTAPPGFHVA